MHEIRATVPVEISSEVAAIALKAGIPHVSVYDIYVHGADEQKQVVSVEASTPKAKAFIDALLASSVYDANRCSITSRELRAILDHQPIAELTRPMIEPTPDVFEDLWQLSYITPGYIGRAAGGAILLADGVIQSSPISIVVAALFLPFLSPVLALGFGIWTGDVGLLRKGLLALFWSTLLALIGGALIAALAGGPIRFHDFKGPLASFGISAVIGIAAGLSAADDAGRRYLIGVAAAVQLAIFPVWFGAAAVLGWPDRAAVIARLSSFAINLVTICAAAVFTYSGLGLRRAEVRRFLSPRRSPNR